jgi:hypothetical protein
MEHVVFFPAHDGSPAFRRVGSIEDAVRLVEHLRNVEGVSEVSVHALTEVPLAFKTWYRVEVPEAAPAEALAEAPVEAPVVYEAPVEIAPIALVPEQSLETDVPVLAAPSSLGFFAS